MTHRPGFRHGGPEGELSGGVSPRHCGDRRQGHPGNGIARGPGSGAQDRLAAIVESSEDAILSRDLDGVITSWNSAAERLFGYTADEVVGREVGIIVPLDRQAEAAELRERVRAGEHLGPFETVRLNKAGQRLDVSLTLSAVRDAAGAMIGVSNSIRDISEHKRAELNLAESTARLRATVAELEAFSYSVSHDLRAPIRAIHGYAEIALRQAEGDAAEPLRELLQRILTASETAIRLTDEVLALTRITRQHFRLGPVDLDHLVRKTIEERPELQADGAQFTVQSPLLPVLGHEPSLRQCLTNLLGNAVKYVAPGTQPRVRLWTELVAGPGVADGGSAGPGEARPKGWVRLGVEDNGIGIAQEDQGQIFEVFHRLHGSQQYEGVGLGLAIVKKAAERMGGRVGVESKPGKGSRFWLELRAAPQS